MSFVGEATGVLGLLGKTWNLLRDRLVPGDRATVANNQITPEHRLPSESTACFGTRRSDGD